MFHKPVLTEELLSFVDKGIWVDATIGTGGHTEAILDRFGDVFIYGIDKDKESITLTKERLKKFKDRLTIIQGNFKNLDLLIKERVSGVVFDIGLSSFQIENKERGFSHRKEGPLDMRFNQEEGLPFYTTICHLTRKEIENILRDYGEEKTARSLAKRIYSERDRIHTTFELKKLIGNDRKKLSRVFQAFRVFVNEELENLRGGLKSALSILDKGGKIVVISYHSLEDRIVKRFFLNTDSLAIITKKPIKPSSFEIASNRRARSAKMRVAEKI